MRELVPRVRAMDIEVPEALRPYLGRYAADLGGRELVFEILAQDGALAVRLPDGRVFELLEPNEEGRRLFAQTDQAAVSFDHDGPDPAPRMTFHQAGAAIECAREDE